jgi:DNA-3-methyladenine glycosylase II
MARALSTTGIATKDARRLKLRPIDTEKDVARALKKLLIADPRLVPVAEIAGALPLRRRAGGFEGLAAIITSQQISTAAAASIWGRFKAAVDPFTPEQYLAASDEALRSVGLSRAKVVTLRGIAAAAADGFDLLAVQQLPAEEAIATMTALKGVGPWTAEIYLLFCLGHPDIFPAGDLALQSAVQHALGLEARPKEKALRALAEGWSPWRGVAARLFWAYYRAVRGRAGVPAGV